MKILAWVADQFVRLKQWVENTPWLHKRWLRIAVQALIVLFCLVYLAANLRTIREAQVTLNWGWVVLSELCAIGSVLLGALGWWLILGAVSQPLAWAEAARIHVFSTLAKYLPGYAWQLLGKAYLTQQAGVPGRAVAAAMLLELAQLVLGGLWLGALAWPGTLVPGWLGTVSLTGWLWAARIGLLLILAGLPFATAWLLKRRPRLAPEVRILPGRLLAAALVIVIGWLFLSLSYWMLGAALRPLPLAQFGLFTFTLAASMLIGLAVLIVPGSIGVRESIMVMILGPALGAPLAVIVAVLSRLVWTLSELLSALGFRIWQRVRR